MVEDVADAVATVGDPTDKYRGPIGEEERSEANACESYDEDFAPNEESRAAGPTSRASEPQWLRKSNGTDTHGAHYGAPWGTLGNEAEAVESRLEAHQQREDTQTFSPLVPVNKMNFYLDDEVLETDLLVDPFVMPPFETAQRLVQAYMESAQRSFPFLERHAFIDRFHHCTLTPFWE